MAGRRRSEKLKSYYPQKRNYDWGQEDSGDSIWIDAPEDLSTILQRERMIANYHIEDEDNKCTTTTTNNNNKGKTIHPYSRMPIPPEKHLFLQGVNCNGDLGLVLSTDAKPRLGWTLNFHERFIEVVIEWVE